MTARNDMPAPARDVWIVYVHTRGGSLYASKCFESAGAAKLYLKSLTRVRDRAFIQKYRIAK